MITINILYPNIKKFYFSDLFLQINVCLFVCVCVGTLLCNYKIEIIYFVSVGVLQLQTEETNLVSKLRKGRNFLVGYKIKETPRPWKNRT